MAESAAVLAHPIITWIARVVQDTLNSVETEGLDRVMNNLSEAWLTGHGHGCHRERWLGC